VAADNLCWRSSGELYFEMEVFEAKGAVYVGFAGANFRAAGLLGDDDKSWALLPGGNVYHR
jgi:hypothetical protein